MFCTNLKIEELLVDVGAHKHHRLDTVNALTDLHKTIFSLAARVVHPATQLNLEEKTLNYGIYKIKLKNMS